MLNKAANEAALLVLELSKVSFASHVCAIHERGIAEAFPSSFLGVLLKDPGDLARGRSKNPTGFTRAWLRMERCPLSWRRSPQGEARQISDV